MGLGRGSLIPGLGVPGPVKTTVHTVSTHHGAHWGWIQSPVQSLDPANNELVASAGRAHNHDPGLPIRWQAYVPQWDGGECHYLYLPDTAFCQEGGDVGVKPLLKGRGPRTWISCMLGRYPNH